MLVTKRKCKTNLNYYFHYRCESLFIILKLSHIMYTFMFELKIVDFIFRSLKL